MKRRSVKNTRFELFFKQHRSHEIWGQTIHLERLYVVLRITPYVPWLESKVDTGAYLSVFPEHKWRKFQAQIQWPTAAEEAALPDWCRRFGGIAGGQIPCRLGLVSIQVVSVSQPPIESAAFPLIALFAFDGGSIETPLFGLGGGAFLHHQFRLDHAQRQAALIPNP